MKPRREGERPSLAELIEFCEGDEGAAMWMAQRWGKLGPTDACMDTAYARTFYRVTVQGYFEERRAEYEAGRKEALFDAIEWAAAMGTPIPEWARVPFAQGWRRYQAVVPDDPGDPSVSTLGGAFGITRPDNFSTPAERFWRMNASYVWQRVTALTDAGTEKNAAFAAVARELTEAGPNLRAYAMHWGLPVEAADALVAASTQKGVSASTVKSVFYQYQRSIDEAKERHQRRNRKPAPMKFYNLSPGRRH